MQRFIHSLSHSLFDFDSSNTLGRRLHIRLIEAALMSFMIWFVWDWGFYVQRNITEVLLPLGFAQYIDISFLFEHYMAWGNAALITVLAGVGFVRLWNPAYMIALVLFHLQYTARYSLGEISHGSNLVGMGVLAFALAVLFFSDEVHRRRFAMGFQYFFIGLGYTSAAFCKLIGTGITWPHGIHMKMWINERIVDTVSKFGAFEPNLLQEMILAEYHWGTAVLVFGLLAELLSFLIWWPQFRKPVLFLVFTMHIGILITMNIFFWASTYLLILLVLPLDRIIDAAWDGQSLHWPSWNALRRTA